MKKTLFQYIIFVLVICTLPVHIHAQNKEAGEAGKLASGAAVVIVKKPDTRVVLLKTYLESVDSPMAEYAEVFVHEADKNNLDWRLVPAIAGLESGFGKHIPPGSFNAFGWGIPTGQPSGIAFKNWGEAISTVSHGLKQNYIDDGLTSIEAIGNRYAASQTWAIRIHIFMDKFEQIQKENSAHVLSMTL